ncbi:MAG: hypothetical protein JWO83_1028 [Caulobacteraceae bacterium]|nr:hypothetical protein [Caulobacteraceae bacterium]
MTPRTMILLAASAAALAAPAAASAQQYGAPYDNRPYYGRSGEYGQPRGDYGQPRGDYGWRARSFRGYPEFRSLEMHIRGEIQQGLSDDTLDREGADDLLGQLQQIRYQEMSEYRAHGWNLPYDDRMRIREDLQRLDQEVDQTRAEP